MLYHSWCHESRQAGLVGCPMVGNVMTQSSSRREPSAISASALSVHIGWRLLIAASLIAVLWLAVAWALGGQG
jgi:hypothetical protein